MSVNCPPDESILSELFHLDESLPFSVFLRLICCLFDLVILQKNLDICSMVDFRLRNVFGEVTSTLIWYFAILSASCAN